MAAKPTRLDSRLLEGSDELVYLCLPDWFRNALLSLTERMLWTRVWLDEAWEDYHLTDSDKARIEYGIYKLTQDDCGVIDMETIQDIIDRLEELENMNINVNCGCGCNGQSKVADPIEGVELIDLCPPDDLPETAPPQVAIGAKCDLSNYLVVQIRTTLLNQWARAQSWPEFSAWWLNLFAWMPTIYVVGQTYASYTAVSQWLAGRAVDWITGNFDPLFNEMVCAVYQSTSPAHAQSSLFTVLDKLPYPLNQSAKAIAQRLPYAALFAGDITSPPGFSGRECCGGTPEGGEVQPLPPPPDGYFWAALVNGEFSIGINNASAQVSYDELSAQFLHQPLTNQNFHEATITVDISDVIARFTAASAHAIYFQYVNPPLAPNHELDAISMSSNTGGLTGMPANQPRRVHYDNTEYAVVGVFADMIDDMDAVKSTYGNGAMDDTKASFSTGTYGTAGAASLRFTVSYLLKE